MIRLAANLSFLFQELPFLERFGAAAQAGFRGVEFMFPYAVDGGAIVAELEKHRLELVLFNLPAGNWDAGERGIACHPDRVEEFKRGVDMALPLAKKLGSRRLNCLAGLHPAGYTDAQCFDTMRDNLMWTASRAAHVGVQLLIEPINSRIDMPGFWLDTPDLAVDLIREVAHDNIAMQFDIYHAYAMDVDVPLALSRHRAMIGHVQLADYPGRHQPGTGGIPVLSVLDQLESQGYRGWVSCEYRPTGATLDSLTWAKPWLAIEMS